MEDDASLNTQLLAWLKEWLDTAKERNSKGATAYKNAYSSLKACPLKFQHPAELKKLKGFGEKLCQRLTEKLEKHCEENSLPMPEHPQMRQAKATAEDGANNAEASSKAKKPRKPKQYVPAFRSGGYAIIIGLSTLDEDVDLGMTKAELIEVAQPHCDASFSAPADATKFYTAWNSIKTLLTKELVYERGRPLRRYALTDEGWEVAKRIRETSQWQAENGAESESRARDDDESQPTTVALDESPEPESQTITETQTTEPFFQETAANGRAITGNADIPTFTPIVLPPGSFSVYLLLDIREIRAKTDRDYMKEELAKQGVTPIMRAMEVGDAQWIAKIHDKELLSRYGCEGDEIVLDWIVERKRLDDLIGSIKDGRFHEQKYRLKRSGVSKVIYIIEAITMDPMSYNRYAEAVQSAIASTQVVNGYFVKQTEKMDDTIKYLSRMTTMLKRTYERKSLNVIPTKILTATNYLPLLNHLRETDPNQGYYITYASFASMASKSEMMTLRDVFLKMLMTTKGVTGEKALEIQKRWKTPNAFVKAYKACGVGDQGLKRKRELVSDQMAGLMGRKKITKAMSQKIAEVWGDA